MRKFIAASLAPLTACSLGMRTVPPGWDGTSEPECTDSPAPVVGDSIMAGISVAVGSIAAEASLDAKEEGNPSTGADVVAIAGFVVALGFVVSAVIGESSYKECKSARAEWRLGGAIGAGVERGAQQQAAKQGAERAAAAIRERQQPHSQQPPPVPRGFFCSSSPSNTAVGFCVRDKAECERTRDVAMGAAPDIAPCSLVESAWCFGDRCSPTEQLCNEQSTRVGGLACVEVK